MPLIFGSNKYGVPKKSRAISEIHVARRKGQLKEREREREIEEHKKSTELWKARTEHKKAVAGFFKPSSKARRKKVGGYRLGW